MKQKQSKQNKPFVENQNNKILPNIGFYYVLIYNVDLDKWCEKYELEPFIGDCLECGCKQVMNVNIPFAGKDKRGLVSNPCKCGNRCVPFQYVDLDYGPNSLNSLGFGNIVEPISLKKTRPVLKLIDNS
jgi:hypothetical protein